MTIAVDDSTKPIAAMKATIGANPTAMPAAVSKAPQAATCTAPRPKICLRMLHNRVGCISRPMMNRNMTTPSSATCRMDCASEKKPSPNGPMISPAAR